jgi:tight adherence protein C
VIALAAVGAALGAVIFAGIWLLARPRPVVLVVLGRYDARHRTAGPLAPLGYLDGDTARRSRQERAGQWLITRLHERGIHITTLRQDVALTGRDLEAVMGRKLVGFAAGFLLAAAGVSGLARVGIALPAKAGFIVPIAIAALFFVLPDLEARSHARARRHDFRRALGAYLDLVRLEMAGSAAPAEALPNAARVGTGWPLALIRDTLYRATTAGQDQWAALAELGESVGVAELRDLGGLLRLVGQDGAQVRDTLAARAASIRTQELAEAEGQASESDQSMSMAQLVIGMAFIVFIGYPAIAAVLQL